MPLLYNQSPCFVKRLNHTFTLRFPPKKESRRIAQPAPRSQLLYHPAHRTQTHDAPSIAVCPTRSMHPHSTHTASCSTSLSHRYQTQPVSCSASVLVSATPNVTAAGLLSANKCASIPA